MNAASTHSGFETLREKAENLLKARNGSLTESSDLDILSLIHELEVHQIELQIQNEELRQTQSELEESRKGCRELYDLAPVGYLTLDTSRTIAGANFCASNALGISRKNLIGRGFSDFIHPEDRAAYFALVEEAADRQEVRHAGEIRLIGTGKEPFWARVEAAAARDEGGELNGWRIVFMEITERKQMEEELRRTRDELEVRVRERTAEVVKANEALEAEIEERRRAEMELEELQTQLRRVQKLEAVGTLAGGVAHDFNNILAIIVGYTEMALRDTPQSAVSHQRLKRVLTAANRAKDLIKQILAFSREGGEARSAIEIAPVIEEALKLLRATLPSTVQLRLHVLAPSATVIGNPTQLNQVVVNLCTNAAHAMRERGGILEVVLEEAELDATCAVAYEDLQPGAYVKLTVKDTGHGMDAATLERVFDPYFTTKEAGEGSGLGLAVVRGIVKRHEGAICVQSEPEKGTVFEILFPLIRSSKHQIKNGVQPFAGGTEHILFVDDEEPLAALGELMLTHLGYRVTTSTNSLEAIQLFRLQPEAFDLVITDYTMPHMTGAELAGEILQVRRNIPIILCTGYSDMISEETAKKLGISAFIIKPVDLQNLAQAIRGLLDKSKS